MQCLKCHRDSNEHIGMMQASMKNPQSRQREVFYFCSECRYALDQKQWDSFQDFLKSE